MFIQYYNVVQLEKANKILTTDLTHPLSESKNKNEKDSFTYLCVQNWSTKDGKMMLSDVWNSTL